MGQRLAVLKLPKEVREELNQRLIATEHSEFHTHSVWLAEKGYKIGKSAIHRYSQYWKKQELECLGADERWLLDLFRKKSPTERRALILSLELEQIKSEQSSNIQGINNSPNSNISNSFNG